MNPANGFVVWFFGSVFFLSSLLVPQPPKGTVDQTLSHFPSTALWILLYTGVYGFEMVPIL